MDARDVGNVTSYSATNLTATTIRSACVRSMGKAAEASSRFRRSSVKESAALMADSGDYHEPTDQERAFLRIVVRGIVELEDQVEHCLIDAYDRTGYCDVRVSQGRTLVPPPAIELGPANRFTLDGAILDVGGARPVWIETMLSVTDGYLDSIEILDCMDSISGDPYELFLRGSANGHVSYPAEPYRDH